MGLANGSQHTYPTAHHSRADRDLYNHPISHPNRHPISHTYDNTIALTHPNPHDNPQTYIHTTSHRYANRCPCTGCDDRERLDTRGAFHKLTPSGADRARAAGRDLGCLGRLVSDTLDLSRSG
jgi:hypothetical protein